MKKQLSAAFLAAAIVCAGADGAMAYQYTFSGVVTSAIEGASSVIPGFLGRGIDVVVHGDLFDLSGDPLYTVGASETTFGASFTDARITIGGTTTTTRAVYFSPSSITNNGITSSLGIHFGDSFASFGKFRGADTTFGIDASSGRADIPLDPGQSFGPISVTGSGTFYAVPTDIFDPPLEGFSIGFNLTTLSGSPISTVPLPASLPSFAVALLSLAACGRGLKRYNLPRIRKSA